MRVLVQGAGAIGLLIAARFARAGKLVEVLTRTRSQAEHIAQHGISLENWAGQESGVDGGSDVQHVATTSLDDASLNAEPDLVVCCVKSYQMSAAIAALRAFLDGKANVPLLIVSNGLSNRRVARAAWPDATLFAGTIDYGAARIGPAAVRATGFGTVCIEAALPQRTCFDAAGFRTRYEVWIEGAIWRKGILNCGINSVASVLGLSNGNLLECPALRVAGDIAEEAARVAAASWARGGAGSSDEHSTGSSAGAAERSLWAREDWRERIAQVCRATADNRCSMLVDIEAGRETEIDALNGEVIRIAESLRMQAPLNRAIRDLVESRCRRANIELQCSPSRS